MPINLLPALLNLPSGSLYCSWYGLLCYRAARLLNILVYSYGKEPNLLPDTFLAIMKWTFERGCLIVYAILRKKLNQEARR